MKIYIFFLFPLFTSLLLAQPRIIQNSKINFTLKENLRKKIVNHKLISDIKQSLFKLSNQLNSNIPQAEQKIGVVVYFEKYPTTEEINELQNLEIDCYLDSWTPPLENHPYGFILAMLPPSKLQATLAKPFIKKMGSSTQKSYPNNNLATISMGANSVWLEGYNGTGIKVAILDSGLDSFYEGTDLPIGYEKKDYSNYPTSIDDDIENTVTGHGTHVTGSALGRGILSNGNTGNGGGAYKGTAPGADLVFLKIGSDANAGASHSAIIGAMDAAINIYNADILSMSYGGWYDYHDGSSLVEHKVDWVYDQGTPFFLAAGNSANDGRHYSGTVLANSTTDFIQVNASGIPTTGDYYLYFNLVWVDGIIDGSTNLDIQFYDNSKTQITTVSDGQTESTRGTESEYFYYDNNLILSGTYYIKVINNSSVDQDFHIYEAWNRNKVKFQNPDPFYTIVQPASADHAFAVGAYTSRTSWIDYNGSVRSFGYAQNDITPFSSLGPRIDGVLKPEITAPGSAILSLKDTDILTSDNAYTIDNDGNLGVGSKNYYCMSGTSMACPLTAGAAALYLQYFPGASPQDVYNALQNNATIDSFTGAVPNFTFGSGKLNIFNAIFNSQLALDITVFLEGAYDVGLDEMTTSLNLPLTQPFNTTPWNYSGTENVSTIPNDVTDWVLIELRTDPNIIASRKPAFLKKDGSVVDLNGYPFKITGTTGSYYIVVDHRNHLSVMSASPVSLSFVSPPHNVPQVEMSLKYSNNKPIFLNQSSLRR